MAVRRADQDGLRHGTGAGPCTAPGWRCAPSSCGRPSRTTTPTAPGPACGGFTPWSGSATASRRSPAKAAELEVDWWRVHRQVQYSAPGVAADDLVESVTRLYCYLFGEPEAEVRPAAVYRVRAMSLSDQWVREGCLPGSPLLPLVRARWSAPTLRCSLPCTTERHRTDASPARLGEQAYGEWALPLCHPVRGTDRRDMRRAGPRTRLQLTAIPGLNPAGELAGCASKAALAGHRTVSRASRLDQPDQPVEVPASGAEVSVARRPARRGPLRGPARALPAAGAGRSPAGRRPSGIGCPSTASPWTRRSSTRNQDCR